MSSINWPFSQLFASSSEVMTKNLASSLRLAKQPVIWILVSFACVMYWALRKRSLSTRVKVSLAIFNLIFRLWGRGRSKIERNLSLIRPDLGRSEIAQGAGRVVHTLARSWATMIGNEHTSLDEAARKCEVGGIESLLEQHRAGNKIIIVVDHVGPFDELFALASNLGLRAYAPVESIRPQWLLRAMIRLRSSFGNIHMEPVKRGETLRRAARHLAQGRIVVLTIDITRRDGNGVLCRIGGAQARFPVGAIKLALAEDAMVFPAFPCCKHGEKFRMVFGPPFELATTGDMNRDIEFNTRRLVEGLYAHHIQENWDSWLRSLWSNLEPAQLSTE